MSTDPIKLIQSVLTPKTNAPAASTVAAAKATPPANDAYKLASSLQELLANGPSGSTTLKGNYTAKGLQEMFQSLHDTRTKQASAAASASKPLDEVLKAGQAAGTNAPALSAQAQEIVGAKQATSSDAGLAKVDERLAQIVGISRTIGSA